MGFDFMQSDLGTFARRVCVAVGIFALAALLLVLLWYASEVLLLVFAAVLLAVFLRGLGEMLARLRRFPRAGHWAWWWRRSCW